MTTYELGYSHVKKLLKLATLDELPAIHRLGALHFYSCRALRRTKIPQPEQ